MVSDGALPALPSRLLLSVPVPVPESPVGDSGCVLDTVDDLARLYESQYLVMLRVARLVTGSLGLAEEAVHDAFVAVYEHRESVEQPVPYLRRVVLNNCHSVQRRKKVERLKIDELGRATGDRVVLTGDLDETWRALDRLSYKQRVALVLRYYEDLTVAEVAEVMGERVGTVKSLIHRGLNRLRKEVLA
jgi:RNA polymerase sigma factor (sigma-70 family)